VASLPQPLRLGLVAARRPADVLAVVGWTGAMNYHATSAPLACVLRSWEDRFGARLVRLGFDTMDLLVERPLPPFRCGDLVVLVGLKQAVKPTRTRPRDT
jgi:Domain of unknown function (DUF4253)